MESQEQAVQHPECERTISDSIGITFHAFYLAEFGFCRICETSDDAGSR